MTIVGTPMGTKGTSMDPHPDKIREARGDRGQGRARRDPGRRRHPAQHRSPLHQAGADWIVPGSLMFGEDPAAMRQWLSGLGGEHAGADTLAAELEDALAEVPILDIHTHLVGGKLAARGLHDILLYHMVISDLYAAGCPTGPADPVSGLAHEGGGPRADRGGLPICCTSRTPARSGACGSSCATSTAGPSRSTAELAELDALIRERADDRPGQARFSTARDPAHRDRIARRGDGEDDDRLQYALEWGFFTRCQWGEFDTALYELERCWGARPRAPRRSAPAPGPPPSAVIRTLDDVHAAIAPLRRQHSLRPDPLDGHAPLDRHRLSARSRTTRWPRRSRRDQAGPAERDIYASYINEAFLTALEDHGEEIVFQFSFGAEPLPFETASRLSQRTIGQVAEMIGRHPRLRFQCFLASRHANQSLCTLARELPNLSLAGYWWHNFFPDTIAQVIRERLDMLPANKQVGFFSDAYCVEWSYAKAVLVRKLLARVLAEQSSGASLDGRGPRLRSAFFSRVRSRSWGWFPGWCEELIDGNRTDRADHRRDGDAPGARGENPFRCRAYHNAAQLLRSLPGDAVGDDRRRQSGGGAGHRRHDARQDRAARHDRAVAPLR